MRIAVVQFIPGFEKLDENCQALMRYCKEIEADLIIFPELATSGYFFQNMEQSRAQAMRADDARLAEFQSLATTKGSMLVIGFAELDAQNNQVYNSCILLHPDESKSRVYRKSHLFYKEKYCFNAGDTGFFVIHDEKHDCRIGMMICYDWRFPEAARSLALLGADLIVCPSNLVTHIWRSVMPVRAIENKVYLAVANRWGSETVGGEEVSFNGQSCIYSYNGSVLASAEAEGNAVLYADIYPEQTRDKSFNAENDILKDRRPELYLTKAKD